MLTVANSLKNPFDGQKGIVGFDWFRIYEKKHKSESKETWLKLAIKLALKKVVPHRRYSPSTKCQLSGTDQDSNSTKKNKSLFHQALTNGNQAPKATEEPQCSKRTRNKLCQNKLSLQHKSSDEIMSNPTRNNDVTDMSSQTQMMSRTLA